MPKKNGYAFYMDSRRDHFVAAGHQNVATGYHHLVPLCSDGWNALPTAEKQRFNDIAKAHNERIRKNAPAPPTKSQASATDPEVRTEEEESSFQKNQKLVKNLFEDGKTWKEQPIIVCSFATLVNPNVDCVYLPCEIGLSAFSLNQGVMGNFCRMFNPGKAPKGYGIEAQETRKKFGLPDLTQYAELSDLKGLMQNLEGFLRKFQGNFDGNSVHIFCLDSDYLLVTRCFKALLEKTANNLSVRVLSLTLYSFLACQKDGKELNGEDGVSPYRKVGNSLTGKFIYPILYPFCQYGTFSCEEDVDDVIKQHDNYRYYEEISCIYHIKSCKEVHHCALNMSNRYSFSILEILTFSNPVRPIPGSHYPELDKPGTEKQRRYEMLTKWGILQMEDEMKVQEPVEETPKVDKYAGVELKFKDFGARDKLARRKQRKE